jgi:hypothetical protein
MSPTPKRGASGRPSLASIDQALARQGLDPIPDPAARTVIAKCPTCAPRTPAEFYPLSVSLNGALAAVCANGCDTAAILDGLLKPAKKEAKKKPSPADYAPPEEKAAADAPPVNGGELLDEIRAFIGRYMVLPSDEAADVLALWTLHTWSVRAAFATPYLRIVSAAADSGKTLLMEILAVVCRNGWHAVNPSTAVLYRKIDRQAPTLLLDEMDNYPIDERRDALAVLNSGYKRGAKVDRCKENGDLETFNAFSPKAYAGLDQRSLVSTLLSRSITVRLERKAPREKVEMWIAPLTEPGAAPLRQRCAAWADQNVDALSTARPNLPDVLTNRAAEIWWALLAIADRAGRDWPDRARRAARALSAGGDEHDDEPEAMMLLADIRDAFGDERVVFTKDLLEKLNRLDERPWGARRKGEGLDARGLSRMLRPFKIRPKTIGSGAASAKGYDWDRFADTFSRHLREPSQASDPSHASPHVKRDATDATAATANPGVGDTTAAPRKGARCDRCDGLLVNIGGEIICWDCDREAST